MKAYKTNSNHVKYLVREHIGDYFKPEDLKSTLEAVKYGNMSDYQGMIEVVMGGSFLIYYSDVKYFLNGLGINPDGKEYSDEKSWELYKHLVAREGLHIINSITL